MIALEFVVPGTLDPSPAAAARVVEECRRGGLLVGKGGLYGNVLRIAPPLIVTDTEADEGLEILAHTLGTVR
jgi:4-aminobutyrate aminotransferase